jgi:hypothetical protein
MPAYSGMYFGDRPTFRVNMSPPNSELLKTLKKGKICSPERRDLSKDRTGHGHCRENPKFKTAVMLLCYFFPADVAFCISGTQFSVLVPPDAISLQRHTPSKLLV